MIGNHSRSSKRSAFTLVELLVVILIIAILVSLISSAVMMAMGKIPEVTARTEITELATGLQGFLSDYNQTDAPPSLLYLNEWTPTITPQDNGRSGQFLQKVFGKNLGTNIDWNNDGSINGPAPGMPWVLQGQQCLVFYLGGIPNTAAVANGMPPSPQGFSTNNMNPAVVGGKRKGPYFNFVTSRLVPVAATGGFCVYLDPWQVKPSANGNVGPMPYAFFSSNGINNGYNVLDCSGLLYTDSAGQHFAMPYWIGTTGTSLTYTYSNTYQIISAGKDGKFGYNAGFPQPNNFWIPASGATGTGADDQANFSSTLLGSGQN